MKCCIFSSRKEVANLTTPCNFCGTETEQHKSECPTLAHHQTEATKAWQNGFDRGYDLGERLIPDWELAKYRNVWFQLGYRKGRALADKETDDAFQAQYSVHRGEY